VGGTCIGTMNLVVQRTLPRVSLSPRVRVGVRGTNAPASQVLSPTRDRDATSRRFMESSNVRGTCTVTMNRGLLPLRYLCRLVRGWRRGPGRGGNLQFGHWSFFGIWSLGFGASPRGIVGYGHSIYGQNRSAQKTKFLSPRKNLAELPLALTAYLAKNISVGVYPIFREVRES